MTPELQLFMVLGALVLLCIIFTLLKRGLMSVKYSLLWLLLAVALVIAAAFPYVFMCCGTFCRSKCRSTWYFC